MPARAPLQQLLFGDRPVSRDDVDLWLNCVAGLPPDSPRRAYYARAWDVAAKIRAAKDSGQWPPA